MSATLQPRRGRRTHIAALPVPGMLSEDQIAAELELLFRHDEQLRLRWRCPRPDCDGMPHDGWLHRHARGKQREPDWAYALWLIMAGRGFGKSVTASHTVRDWVMTPNQQIGVMAKKLTLVRTGCFEHRKSGLLRAIPKHMIRNYVKASDDLRIELTNGSTIHGFSAESPDNVRSWEFDGWWLDEYGAWPKAKAADAYDQVQFTLREAAQPRVIVTTTPRPLQHVRELVKECQDAEHRAAETGEPVEAVLVRGTTYDNAANLSPKALERYRRDYEGTRAGRQELHGELLEDIDGALWSLATFDYHGEHLFRLPRHRVPALDRVVVAVDPATTSKETSDNTAMTVAGRSRDPVFTWRDPRAHAFVLHTEQHRETPRAAMSRAIRLYHEYGADAIVVEANNGGDYLPAVIELLDPTVNVRVVNASRDKRSRAAPVATTYEQERVHHCGARSDSMFGALEDQMTLYTGLDPREDSPDLLDSLVWAVTDLLLDPATMSVARSNVIDNRGRGRR